MLGRRRRLWSGLVLGSALIAAVILVGARSGGEPSPRAAARAYLEATLRGDRATARRLTARSDAATEEMAERAIDARVAVWRAARRVEDAITTRWGAGAAAGAGWSRGGDEELRAVDAAPLESDGATATLRVPGRRPLVLERRWGTWKVVPAAGAAPDAWERRMAATSARAPVAADEVVRAIDAGACADARCAVALFERILLARTAQGR